MAIWQMADQTAGLEVGVVIDDASHGLSHDFSRRSLRLVAAPFPEPRQVKFEEAPYQSFFFGPRVNRPGPLGPSIQSPNADRPPTQTSI